MKKIYIFLCMAMLVVASGCIKNDIDYAVVPLSISELTVEGQVGNTVISEDDRTATVTLNEAIDLASVKVINIEYRANYKKDTANVHVESIRTSLQTDVIDLTKPYSIILSLYQDYEWKIIAKQRIGTELKLNGQIGDTTFVDQKNRLIIAYVNKDTDIENLQIEKFSVRGKMVKADQLVWTTANNIAESTFQDLLGETWTVRVERLPNNVKTFVSDAWVNVSWLHGLGAEPSQCTFEYKKKDVGNWTAVSSGMIDIDHNGMFHVRLSGLEENTQYEYRTVYNNTYGEIVSFTTVSSQDIPNMGFEDWSMQNNKVICPWAEGDESFWDCGNWGSTTLGAKYNITTSCDEVPDGSKGKLSARLETKSILGILATGNMFAGKYKKTLGFNGLLGMGRSFDSYPTRLTGYYKYEGKIINKVSKGYEYMMNQPDSCFMYVVLGDWDEDGEGTYVKIQTDKGNNNGTYFDVNDPHIIAYGSLTNSKKIGKFTKFSIELDYRSVNRRPTAIMCVFAASKYGDYFVGAEGSTLWLDDMNLEYDY